jgi:hypothetical protein
LSLIIIKFIFFDTLSVLSIWQTNRVSRSLEVLRLPGSLRRQSLLHFLNDSWVKVIDLGFFLMLSQSSLERILNSLLIGFFCRFIALHLNLVLLWLKRKVLRTILIDHVRHTVGVVL